VAKVDLVQKISVGDHFLVQKVLFFFLIGQSGLGSQHEVFP
jgi:hypothetical protein